MLSLLALILLVGCTSSQAKLNGAKDLFAIDGKTYTEEDYLNLLLSLDYGQLLIQHVEDDVVQGLLDEGDFDVDAEVEEEIKKFQDYAGMLEMSFEQLISTYGFSDVEHFMEQLRRSAVMDLYTKNSIEENFDQLIKDYGIVSMKVYQVKDEETAKQMVRYIESDYEMDQFEEEFEFDSVKLMHYHHEVANLSEAQVEMFKNLSSTKVTYEQASNGFAVYVYEEDVDKKELVSLILQDTQYAQGIMIDLIQKNNLKIYNSSLKKNMSVDFSEYIK